jgi:hypothetical protein
MTATGERTMKTSNHAEAEGRVGQTGERTGRIPVFVLLIILTATILISARLFATARAPVYGGAGWTGCNGRSPSHTYQS